MWAKVDEFQDVQHSIPPLFPILLSFPFLFGGYWWKMESGRWKVELKKEEAN